MQMPEFLRVLLQHTTSLWNCKSSIDNLNSRMEKCMADQATHAAELNALAARVAKIGEETKSLIEKVRVLTDAVANAGGTTPEVDAAAAALSAQLELVDGLVDDLPPPVLPPAK